MEIRTATRNDRDAIIRLSEESDSTPRTAKTWDGNPIQAALAFDDGRLIGMLPLEERTWETGQGDSLNVLWATGVHVDKAYRNQGIGSKLSAYAEQTYADRFEASCVFREDETSPAYNWYRMNGFHPLAAIRAYRLPLDEVAPGGPAAESDFRHLTTRDDFARFGSALAACFNRANRGFGGFRKRTPEFWTTVWDSHYYRDFYRYSILALMPQNDVSAFALLGETDMRDNVPRFDLLEFVSVDGTQDALHAAVAETARQARLREVRLQTTADDCRTGWLHDVGYQDRHRSTSILGKLLAPRRALARRTPNGASRALWRSKEWDTAQQPYDDADGVIDASDGALTRFCFRRLTVGDAVAADDITDLAAAQSEGLTPWRYYQVDYI